jgi:geranylgeranyl pyrophosphate synthase
MSTTRPPLVVTPLVRALHDHFSPDNLATCLDLGVTVPARLWDKALHGPLAGFLGRPGKEFRRRLVDLGWSLGGGTGGAPAMLQGVVEALHAGSLVIDDIEDNSPERRGAPTMHRVHGIPVALNAGNWLYFWAFSLIGGLGLDAGRQCRLVNATVQTMLRAHHGQALDVSVRVHELAREEVGPVVFADTALKTGALTELATTLGAVAAGADDQVERAAATFGRTLGVGLQTLDDVGSLSSPRRRQKAEEDLRQARPTWAWALLANTLSDADYKPLREDCGFLFHGEADAGALACEMVQRLPPDWRKDVRSDLHGALERLRQSVPAHRARALEPLEADITLLEQSYD